MGLVEYYLISVLFVSWLIALIWSRLISPLFIFISVNNFSIISLTVISESVVSEYLLMLIGVSYLFFALGVLLAELISNVNEKKLLRRSFFRAPEYFLEVTIFVSLCLLFFYLWKAYGFIGNDISPKSIYKLRLASIGGLYNELMISELFVATQVFLVYYALSGGKEHKKAIVILLLFSFAVAIIKVERIGIFQAAFFTFLASYFMCFYNKGYRRNILSRKAILAMIGSVALLFSFFIGFSVFRDNLPVSVALTSLLNYWVGSYNALDVNLANNLAYGDFRGVLGRLSSLPIIEKSFYEEITYEPVGSHNTFTYLADIYKAGGVLFLMLGIFLLGVIYQLLYRQALGGNVYCATFYCFYSFALFISFFDYMFFSTYWIYVFLAVAFLWVMPKRNIGWSNNAKIA